MITTTVFSKTLEAYNKGFRIIANKGGTRSSKTFSELQLFYQIMKFSKKQRIISTVSHSFPHLFGGAIRDFENILDAENLPLDQVRNITPRQYKINKTLHEFIGFDKPGKALGAARDILFMNEANKLPFSIAHQLMQRTTETIFLDWNPSEDFWFDTEGYAERDDCIVIDSTFLDNIQNLTEGQIADLYAAKQKADKEAAAGKKGYWWNWWQVYGLGLRGQLEGVIFQNWQTYNVLPTNVDLYKMWVIDWGGADPTTYTELNFDGECNRLYIKSHVYQPQIRNSELISTIHNTMSGNELVVCDSARRDKIWELQMAGINAHKCRKYSGVKLDNIDSMQEFDIFVHESSKDAITEFETYKRVQDKITGKFLNEPEDGNDHVIDPTGYGVEFYRRLIKPL